MSRHCPGLFRFRLPMRIAVLEFGEDVQDCDQVAADMIDQVITWEGPDTVAGVILEPLISGGGMIIPSPKYLQRVAEI